MRRKQLLQLIIFLPIVALLVLLVSGCDMVQGLFATPTPTQTNTPTPTNTSIPTFTPTRLST